MSEKPSKNRPICVDPSQWANIILIRIQNVHQNRSNEKNRSNSLTLAMHLPMPMHLWPSSHHHHHWHQCTIIRTLVCVSIANPLVLWERWRGASLCARASEWQSHCTHKTYQQMITIATTRSSALDNRTAAKYTNAVAAAAVSAYHWPPSNWLSLSPSPVFHWSGSSPMASSNRNLWLSAAGSVEHFAPINWDWILLWLGHFKNELYLNWFVVSNSFRASEALRYIP